MEHLDSIIKIANDVKQEFSWDLEDYNIKFSGGTSSLREILVQIENNYLEDNPREFISNNSPRNISLKYQLDFLRRDIAQLVNQYSFALAQSRFYLKDSFAYTYQQDIYDFMYWYNIDFAYRLASSGWDRLSYLLNIGFNLKIQKYNLSNILKEIPNRVHQIEKNDNYKRLKNFRDHNLIDLEYKLGEGARHETTHLISRSTRFFCEFTEILTKNKEFNPKIQRQKAEEIKERQTRDLRLLEEHFGHYINGIDNTLNLIGSYFDKIFYEDNLE